MHDAGVPFERRLDEVYAGIKEVIERTRPEALAIEKLFYQHNQTTVIGVAEARGVILLAAAQAGLPIYEYTPMQVKQAVTGYGKAVKKQVQEMTRVLLHLPPCQSRTIPPMRWQWRSPSATPTATSSTALSVVWPGRSDPLTGSVRLQRRGTEALPKGELNRGKLAGTETERALNDLLSDRKNRQKKHERGGAQLRRCRLLCQCPASVAGACPAWARKPPFIP